MDIPIAMEHHLAIESFSYSWLINLKPNSFDYCPSRDDDEEEEEEDIFGPPDHGPFDHENLYYYHNQEECFIEMDPKSKKWQGDLKNAAPIQDFNFHVSADTSVVDADQIFADGLLVPLQHHHRHHVIAAATNSSSSCSTRMLKEGAISSLKYYCCSPPFSEATTPHSPLSPFNSTMSSPSSSSSSTTSLFSSTTSHPPPQAAFLPRCQRYSRRIFGFLSPFCWSWLLQMKRMRRRRCRRGILNVASSPPRMSTSSSSSSSSAAKRDERHIMLGMASDVERSISEAVLHCKRSNGELGL